MSLLLSNFLQNHQFPHTKVCSCGEGANRADRHPSLCTFQGEAPPDSGMLPACLSCSQTEATFPGERDSLPGSRATYSWGPQFSMPTTAFSRLLPSKLQDCGRGGTFFPLPVEGPDPGVPRIWSLLARRCFSTKTHPGNSHWEQGRGRAQRHLPEPPRTPQLIRSSRPLPATLTATACPMSC